jgi:hypothetical protein
MKTILLGLILITLSTSAFATDIATCSNPSGKTYFPYLGNITKNKSGWYDDEIKGGITQVTVDDKGLYDVLFVDATKKIISSRKDGGEVLLYAIGRTSFGLVVIYPQKTVETYSFVKNNDGALEYFQTTVRAGDSVHLVKGSLLRGTCSFINFNGLK